MYISEYIKDNNMVKEGDVLSYDLFDTEFSNRYRLAKEVCSKGIYIDDTWGLPSFSCFLIKKEKDRVKSKRVIERVKIIKTKVLYKQLAKKNLDFEL